MLKDSMNKQKFNCAKLPKLKGHVKLTLRDAETGKIEKEIEGDNIITNAVKDIFACNYLGCIDYHKTETISGTTVERLTPLYKTWYRGILCYKYAHPTDENGNIDPDDYRPQSNDDNPLTAHAGGTVITDVSDDTRRGNPVTFATTDNSVTMAWEWGTTQGNGQIQALSLTHGDTGDAGLGSTSNMFAAFNPFVQLQCSALGSVTSLLGTTANDFVAQYDENHGIGFTIGEYGDFTYGNTRFETNYLTIYIRRMAYEKAGLFDTLSATTDRQEVFTVSVPSTVGGSTFHLYCQPSFYFDYDNKELWIFSNLTSVNTYDADDIKYVRIPCPLPYDETVSYSVGDYVYHKGASDTIGTLYKCTSATSGTRDDPEEWDANDWTSSITFTSGNIHSNTGGLAPTSMEKNPNSALDRQASVMRFANIIKEGDYFFFPTTSGVAWGNGIRARAFFNVNGLNKINITDNSDESHITFTGTQGQFRFAMYNGGLLVNNGKVINGANAYSCQSSPLSDPDNDNSGMFIMHEPYRPVTLAYSQRTGSETSATYSRYILANKMLNTTMYNLVDEYGQQMTITKLPTQSMTITYTLTEVTDGSES
jgi:hypothetical protein